MSLDHYVTLGRSGLRVSPLCLGAMTFGEDLAVGVLLVPEVRNFSPRETGPPLTRVGA